MIKMGFAEWFSFKSKAEKERELRQYEKWAFPFGSAQKEKLTQLVAELLPEEPGKAAMMIYLMGREGYRGSVKEDPEEIAAKPKERRMRRAMAQVDSMLPNRRKKKLLSRYVALILADSEVDETLNYPSVEQLRRQAEELEPVLKNIR